MIVNVQLPPGATLERTTSVMQQVEGYILKQPEVQSMVGVLGFSFSGQGQNAALAFVTLKDWSERKGAGATAQAVAGRAFGALSGIRDAFIFPLSPPPIPELGTASGFTFRLQDRGGNGPRGAARRAQPVAGHGRAKQGAGAGAPRRPGRRAAAADRHRPRQGQRAGRVASTPSTRRISTSLGSSLHQRLPQPRPPAARGGAGRRARPHAAG